MSSRSLTHHSKQQSTAKLGSEFLGQPLTVGVITWLRFKMAMAAPNWQQSLPGPNEKPLTTITEWLTVLTKKQKIHHGVTRAVLAIPVIVVALIAIGVMAGALSYSGHSPVNLWLIIGVFSVLPLLLTFATIVSIFFSSQYHMPISCELLSTLVAKLSYGFNAQSLLASPAARSWLLLAVQWLGLVFQCLLVITFSAVLLFNDVTFGWSSTIVKDPQILQTFFDVFTWPWRWVLEAPSQSLVINSQYYRAASLPSVEQAAMTGNWWPHLLYAMIVYGVLPKALLVIWLRLRTQKILIQEITNSAETERFFYVLNLSCSIDAEPTPVSKPGMDDKNLFVEPLLTPPTEALIFWQTELANNNYPCIGLKRWQDDELWLKKNVPSWHNGVSILVQNIQVPTEELADIIQLVRELNTQLSIALLVQCEQSNSAVNPRQVSQQKTWQYFASKNNCLVTYFVALAGLSEHELKRVEGEIHE